MASTCSNSRCSRIHLISFLIGTSYNQLSNCKIIMTSKIRLRRFCLLLSYCGKNYSGMQRNPGAHTIEECLLKALRDGDIITEDIFVRPQLMYFQRAARTDKGVSAIRQIVSLKTKESITSSLDKINSLLPSDIRLMSCKRVTASFDAKTFCDARTYSYLMPSYALSPHSDELKEDYRVPDDVIKKFNEILEGYVGVHVFHNFTSGKSFKEDSSKRIIRYMQCSEPFYPCHQKQVEFVIVRVKGQSFMMHQIRKMIGLALAIIKGYATDDHLRRSMEGPFMDVPKAPGLGLMLEETHFDRYNRKYGCDGQHEALEWSAVNEAIDKFKYDYIYPVVVEAELKEKSMINWMQTLKLHSYQQEINEVMGRPNRGKSKDQNEDTGENIMSTTPKKIKLDDQSEKIDDLTKDSEPRDDKT